MADAIAAVETINQDEQKRKEHLDEAQNRADDKNALPRGCTLKSTARQSAGSVKRARAQNIAFRLAKATNKPLLVNSEAHFHIRLYKRGGNGNTAILFRLDHDNDPRTNHPKIPEMLKEHRLQAAVRTGKLMEGLVIPVSTAFEGSDDLRNMMDDSSIKGLWYDWLQGDNGDFGDFGVHDPHVITLTPELEDIYKNIRWPSPAEMLAAVPIINLDDLAVEDARFMEFI